MANRLTMSLIRRMRMKKICIGMILLSFVLVSCSPATKMTGVWRRYGYLGESYDKVLVICIARTTAVRKQVEDEFVEQIQKRGRQAFVSYSIIPDYRDIKKEIVLEKISGRGIEAVLVTSLIERRPKEPYSLGGQYQPEASRENMYAYSEKSAQQASSPQYSSGEEIAVLETNVYETETEKLIWSGFSETRIKGSIKSAVQSYIEVAMESMVDSKVF